MSIPCHDTKRKSAGAFHGQRQYVLWLGKEVNRLQKNSFAAEAIHYACSYQDYMRLTTFDGRSLHISH